MKKIDKTLEQLKKILRENGDKKITVLGTTCVGKTTLLKNIPEGIEISKLAPVLTDDEKDFYYNAPMTDKNEEKRLNLRPRRALVKIGQPAFGTGIAKGTELIIYLTISDSLLKKRTQYRDVDFKDAKIMQKFIEKDIKKSKLPVIKIEVLEN